MADEGGLLGALEHAGSGVADLVQGDFSGALNEGESALSGAESGLADSPLGGLVQEGEHLLGGGLGGLGGGLEGGLGGGLGDVFDHDMPGTEDLSTETHGMSDLPEDLSGGLPGGDLLGGMSGGEQSGGEPSMDQSGGYDPSMGGGGDDGGYDPSGDMPMMD